MKILMINGTMKRGCTYTVGKLFIDRMKKPEDTVEELFLPRELPEFCRGCARCILEGEEKCPDYLIYMKRLTEKIDAADFLVFTTPVLVYHASGQMKALLDHYGYRWMVHRPEASMFRKQALCITTAAGAGMRSALKDMTDSLRWWGVAKIYRFGVAVGSPSFEEADQKVKDKVKEAAERIAGKVRHDPNAVKPSLLAKLLFYVMRAYQKKKGGNQADLSYWESNGWLGKKRPWREPKG